MKKFIAMSLVATIAAVGCKTIDTPPAVLNGYTPTEAVKYTLIDRKISDEDLLKTTLENIISSELLNHEFISELQKINFFLKSNRHSSIDGEMLSNGDIYLYPNHQKNKNESRSSTIAADYSFVITVHELSHYYWEYIMPFEIKAKFIEDNLLMYDKFYDILEQKKLNLSNAEEAEPEICKELRLSTFQFTTFLRYLRQEDFYRKHYGDAFFELNYFGTEGFAFMIDWEAVKKAEDLEIIHSSYESSNLDINRYRALAPERLTKIERIPNRLREYYKGFLNPKFFK